MEIFKDFIKSKYKLGKQIYKTEFIDQKEDQFLFYFDILNVYALFPSILEFELRTGTLGNTKLELELTDKESSFVMDGKKIKKKLKDVIKKDRITFEVGEQKKDDIYVRKFFSYEVVDFIADSYGGEYVTVAWLKCYEILEWYKLINDVENFTYFGICEQPGAFLYAINHYIKTNTHVNKFNFILQSLKVTSSSTVGFSAERTLFSEYKNNYDYGPKQTGDVTDIENIKYYRKKYYDTYINLISADCGLNCSDDFSLQEKKVFNILYGNVLIAISLASKGTNYFFKLFSTYELGTISLINLLTCLFEKVYISRVLTTKPTSGEVYCICKNFKYTKIEMDPHIENLYSLFVNNKLPSINSNIFEDIANINKILFYRRALSFKMIYFRFINSKYTTEKTEVAKYIYDLVSHYKKYYVNHYKLKVLEDENRLVTKKIISKWKNKTNLSP